jgi:hypothetical protein
MKSGSLNLLEPSGPHWACYGTALPLPLHVSNTVTIHHQDVVTVHSAYGIYHADNILKLCKITYIYIVTKSIQHCFVYNFNIFCICCIYSNFLLMMNSYSIRNMQRIDYRNKLRKKSASCWSLLSKYITMHGPENVNLIDVLCHELREKGTQMPNLRSLIFRTRSSSSKFLGVIACSLGVPREVILVTWHRSVLCHH